MKKFIALAYIFAAFCIASAANAAVGISVGVGGVIAPAPMVPAPVMVAPAPVVVAPYCRQFRQQVIIGNRIRSTYGTACQQPDGTWVVVNPPAYAVAPGPTVAYVQPEPVIEGEVIIGRAGWYHGRFWDGHHWR